MFTKEDTMVTAGRIVNDFNTKNRIVYLFDHLVVKIDDKIKEGKRFLEVCEFIYLVDDKEKKRFTGNFIDALEFIKQEGSFYG